MVITSYEPRAHLRADLFVFDDEVMKNSIMSVDLYNINEKNYDSKELSEYAAHIKSLTRHLKNKVECVKESSMKGQDTSSCSKT